MSDKTELIPIKETKLQGVLLRPRARWIDEGEKITKYVYGLEKRDFVSKQIIQLTLNDGNVLTETDEVVEDVNSFKINYHENKRRIL